MFDGSRAVAQLQSGRMGGNGSWFDIFALVNGSTFKLNRNFRVLRVFHGSIKTGCRFLPFCFPWSFCLSGISGKRNGIRRGAHFPSVNGMIFPGATAVGLGRCLANDGGESVVWLWLEPAGTDV